MAADIRPARASDVDALLAVENAVFQTDRLQRQSFRRLIDRPSAAVLVAQTGDQIAGYCIVLFRAGTPAARLYSIATVPGMAGQGVGRALIEAAEKAAIDARKTFAEAGGPRGQHAGGIDLPACRLSADRRQARLLSGWHDRSADGEAVGRRRPCDVRQARKATFAASGSFSRLTEPTPRRASL